MRWGPPVNHGNFFKGCEYISVISGLVYRILRLQGLKKTPNLNLIKYTYVKIFSPFETRVCEKTGGSCKSNWQSLITMQWSALLTTKVNKLACYLREGCFFYFHLARLLVHWSITTRQYCVSQCEPQNHMIHFIV